MNTPNEPSIQNMPVCPYCEANPCVIMATLIGLGPVVAGVFHCSACHKVLGVSPVPSARQEPDLRDYKLIVTGKQ